MFCSMSNFFNSSDFRLTDLELLSPQRVVGHNWGVVNLDIVIKQSLRYINNERKKMVPNGVWNNYSEDDMGEEEVKWKKGWTEQP